MRPMLIESGPFALHSYTAFVLLGLGLALWTLRAFAVRNGLSLSLLWTATLWTLAGGLVGARGLYVLLYWPDFSSAPASALQIERGGMIWYGGLIGGALGLYLRSRLARQRFLSWADAAAPALALGYGVAQIGCFLGSLCYGAPAVGPLSMELPDAYGLVDFRHPTQLLAAGVNLGLAAGLWGARRSSPFEGFASLLYLALFSISHALLGFTRGDESLYVAGLRFDQIIGAALASGALAALVAAWLRGGGTGSLAPIAGAQGSPQ